MQDAQNPETQLDPPDLQEPQGLQTSQLSDDQQGWEDVPEWPDIHSQPFDMNQYVDPHGADELLASAYDDLAKALARASNGVSSRVFQLDETVTFMLDNHQEVRLRVRQIEVESNRGQALTLRVHCRTDFENVLVLAKKLKMRIGAFSSHFSVVLSGQPEFVATWNEAIMALDHPSRFFETLDELKRPIFLNLNHYIIARISD